MSKIVAAPVAVVVAGVALAITLVGGVVMSGLVGLELGAPSGEATSKPLKTAFARVLFDDNADGKFFEKSRGVVDVAAVGSGSTRVYCFDLSFVPKVAAGSAYFTNNATVAVWLPGQSGSTGCPASHSDAAAKTLAGNTSEQLAIVNFNIIFHG